VQGKQKLERKLQQDISKVIKEVRVQDNLLAELKVPPTATLARKPAPRTTLTTRRT
jgi:hypothetical protein